MRHTVFPSAFSIAFSRIKSSVSCIAMGTLAVGFATSAQASCGSAFCSLATDFGANPTGPVEGSLFDLHYEYIRQDQPRAGSHKVQVGEITRDHDEVSTKNKNLVATYTHSLASGWGFSVAAPLVDRQHLHIGNEPDGPVPESWKFRELGDIRVTGRYQTTLNTSGDGIPVAGMTFGLKLPTGRTNVTNAAGELAERTLQPGSGTTDVLLGAFFQQPMPQQDAAWFARVQYQHALNSHNGFKPGAQFAADVGYAKVLGEKVTGVVQLNTVFKARDQGAQADPEDSGGRFLFLSPGVSYQVTGSVRAYAYYQQPLHQHVNGVQLTASRAFVVGMSTSF